jgi:hypothetical protein
MTVAAAHEAVPLELPGGSVPVLLFAGGTTGLVLLGSTEPARSFCAALGEAAEEAGLSALAFAGAISRDAALAAGRAAGLLERLGVEHTVLVGVGDEAAPALRAATGDTFTALVLAEPRIREEQLAPLLADLRIPKLMLVKGDDPAAQATAAAAYRHAIGPFVVRHLPGGESAGETIGMIAEAAIAFAIGVCGDGRRA